MKTILLLLVLKICFSESVGDGLSQAIHKMTGNLYKNLATETINKNIVISPLSIHTAMSILKYGAAGYSKGQLENALGLKKVSKTEHLEALKNTMDAYENLNNENVTLKIANAVYGAKDFNVKSDFMSLVENQFDAEIATLDFSDKKRAVQVINDWAANKTNDLINDLVSEEGLDKDVQMVILNAVYFKAKWLKPFNKRGTSLRSFKVPKKGAINTEFMFLSDSVDYAIIKELNASLIALSYIDEDYKMLIFHPLESSSVKELENKLFSSNKTIEEYSSELKKTEISLLFPKFETGSDMSLVKPFQKLGVTDIFGDRANFTGITDDNNIKVGDIIHKTKLTVSEEGSEAAAVSGAVLDTRSGPVRKKINIDSPFIFYIYDTKRQIPLFMGKIVDPSKDNKEPLHSLDNPLEKDQEIFSSTKASVDDDKLKPEDEDRIKFEEEVSTKSSTKVCPGGDLDTCIDSCDFETTREHRICIRSCARKCPDLVSTTSTAAPDPRG